MRKMCMALIPRTLSLCGYKLVKTEETSEINDIRHIEGVMI